MHYSHPSLKNRYEPRRLCSQIPDFPAVRKGMLLMLRQSYVTLYFYEHSYNSVLQRQPRDRGSCDTITTHDPCSSFSILGIEFDSAAYSHDSSCGIKGKHNQCHRHHSQCDKDSEPCNTLLQSRACMILEDSWRERQGNTAPIIVSDLKRRSGCLIHVWKEAIWLSG